jgi:hypothetical protein
MALTQHKGEVGFFAPPNPMKMVHPVTRIERNGVAGFRIFLRIS